MTSLPSDQFEAVNKAFTKQAQYFDFDDSENPILQAWRKQIYQHVNLFLKPNSKILELNSGTGIDAVHFAKQGHKVHATDLSDGMIEQIKIKAADQSLAGRLTFQQISFERLELVEQKNFDYIFSNFGGLNCTDDLGRVTRHFPQLLKPGGYVSLVIMPPVCPWEILSILRGNKNAFRRLNKKGLQSHLEGEYFKTYYYGRADIKLALGKSFSLVKSEGIGALSPPPSKSEFPFKHPAYYNWLTKLDKVFINRFPFNKWADHVVSTFCFKG